MDACEVYVPNIVCAIIIGDLATGPKDTEGGGMSTTILDGEIV